ncbi:unnamed protein product [Dimorphilus gyrociliatus]|uniref:tRNA(His) guanylyltransferase n=1 Tax=Dimorphilus gyrociliatus TaxID=2664684 RepID=A0A7I8VPG9_9ANNE|nr:unnamed protein product [Dimorphilus gyrociliatus]
MVLKLIAAVTPVFRHIHSTKMAKSRFEYVKKFEMEDKLLLNSWIVLRIDGKGFHKFSDKHNFEKPNDIKALNLMNKCAKRVIQDFNEIILAYGQSDEYSFIFRRDTKCYNRRQAKILTNVVSLFTSSYVFYWKEFMTTELLYAPSFDGRITLYPTDKNLIDYVSWRQADCHINNLYNTCFWKLVQTGGLSPKEAEETLRVSCIRINNFVVFNYNQTAKLASNQKFRI